MTLDETHVAGRQSWVASANGHADFPLQNLPFGIAAPEGEDPRGCVAIGDQVLELKALAGTGVLEGEALEAATSASGPTLNAFLALGAGPRRALRRSLFALLADGAPERTHVEPCLRDAASCRMLLPARIGDYTDFYAGIHHAENVGRLFRPDQSLLPNYRHVPIGYHGRASSVRVSGEPFRRPRGQVKPQGADAPCHAPTARLDYELELAIWIGPGNAPGEPIPVAEAADRIAGYGLLNDWSARDIQAWEYQPLGPFLSKSFATTVSPWIVTPEALAPFRAAGWTRSGDQPQPLPYLADAADREAGGLAISLDVLILTDSMRSAGQPPHRLARSDTRHLWWSPAQLVAHHTVAGCDLSPGDLFGSGTISGPGRDSLGSLLEATEGGKRPVTLPNGETRTFLEDGDEIVLRARAEREGYASIGFGECRARVIG